MAGNYADVPGHRMAYDRDGSVGFWHTGGTVTVLTSGQMAELNDEDTAYLGNPLHNDSFGGGFYVGIIFPELRDMAGWFVFAPSQYYDATSIQTSPDTTNGLDGTWTTRSIPTSSHFGVGTVPGYRTNIQTLTTTGVKGWRLHTGNSGGGGTVDISTIHLYGSIAAGQHPHRLRLWHPTLDQEVGPAYFDWGNAARSTTEDRTFRVKNNSDTYTATSVTVGIEALSDTTPTVVGQHTFSLDGSTFTATVAPPNIAPGAISGVITLRRTTPANAVLSVWAARIKAEAALV